MHVAFQLFQNTLSAPSVDTPLPDFPKIGLLRLLLKPGRTLAPFAQAEHVPFTALWSVLSAFGIVFYSLLPIYPREGFVFNDFLATLVLLSPFIGLIALRMAAWVLAKSGRFFRGKGNTRLCQAALGAGLLPLGTSLIITLPIFLMFPNETFTVEIKQMIGLPHMIASLWSLVNVLNAVSAVHQISKLHAGVALMGMIGFLFAVFNIISVFAGGS